MKIFSAQASLSLTWAPSLCLAISELTCLTKHDPPGGYFRVNVPNAYRRRRRMVLRRETFRTFIGETDRRPRLGLCPAGVTMPALGANDFEFR